LLLGSVYKVVFIEVQNEQEPRVVSALLAL